MLKISAKQELNATSLYVEGRLAGPWVPELERCWQQERARAGLRQISVILGAVTFIDDTGKQLLGRMFRSGTKLDGCGCHVRAILAAITKPGDPTKVPSDEPANNPAGNR